MAGARAHRCGFFDRENREITFFGRFVSFDCDWLSGRRCCVGEIPGYRNMNVPLQLPLQLGDPLPDPIWHAVQLETIFECCKWDVQSEDHCVLAEFPLLITQSGWQQLSAIAEALSRELAAAERELLARKDLHNKLGLPRALREEFGRLADPTPGVARVMRFDFHFTDEGWRISEVNADVPGGFIEASGFTQRMAAHYPGTITPPDPACVYARTLRREFGPDAA